MGNLLIILLVAAAAFAALDGTTIDGTHYHFKHSEDAGVTWHAEKTK